MLLTLTTSYRPATDLGYLLHKNPSRPQVFELAFGNAHVFYPHADPDRCTAALLLEIDRVGLVRNRHGPAGEGFSLEPDVNDRPYVASSFLSVAIAQVFGSALSGTSRERPISLNEHRLSAVLTAVRDSGAKRVLDLGCSYGNLLRRLLEEKQFEQIVGLDVSHRALEIAADRLRLDRLRERQRQRVQLVHGSLIYRDHRFEWTRQPSQNWATNVAERFGYSVRFLAVGPQAAEVGPPTQMGVFGAG